MLVTTKPFSWHNNPHPYVNLELQLSYCGHFILSFCLYLPIGLKVSVSILIIGEHRNSNYISEFHIYNQLWGLLTFHIYLRIPCVQNSEFNLLCWAPLHHYCITMKCTLLLWWLVCRKIRSRQQALELCVITTALHNATASMLKCV